MQFFQRFSIKEVVKNKKKRVVIKKNIKNVSTSGGAGCKVCYPGLPHCNDVNDADAEEK